MTTGQTVQCHRQHIPTTMTMANMSRIWGESKIQRYYTHNAVVVTTITMTTCMHAHTCTKLLGTWSPVAQPTITTSHIHAHVIVFFSLSPLLSSPVRLSNRNISSFPVPLGSFTIFSISAERGFPDIPSEWRRKSRPNSQGRTRRALLFSSSSLRCVMSPSSVGKLLSLFPDRSRWERLCSFTMSGGIRCKLLSFRYSAVRCWNVHRDGLRFLMGPLISRPVHRAFLPFSCSSLDIIMCILLGRS